MFVDIFCIIYDTMDHFWEKLQRRVSWCILVSGMIEIFNLILVMNPEVPATLLQYALAYSFCSPSVYVCKEELLIVKILFSKNRMKNKLLGLVLFKG